MYQVACRPPLSGNQLMVCWAVVRPGTQCPLLEIILESLERVPVVPTQQVPGALSPHRRVSALAWMVHLACCLPAHEEKGSVTWEVPRPESHPV